jgi:hypothetical protein
VARRALKKFNAEQAAQINAEASTRRSNNCVSELSQTLACDDELGISRMTVCLLECEKELIKEGEAVSPVAQNALLSLKNARNFARRTNKPGVVCVSQRADHSRRSER